MNYENLSDYFTGVAIKRLSSVEINPVKSNQHEINGVTKLKSLLGVDKKKRFFEELWGKPPDKLK